MTKATVKVCSSNPRCVDKAMTCLGNVKGVNIVELEGSSCIKVTGKFSTSDLVQVVNSLCFVRLVSVEEEEAKAEPKCESKQKACHCCHHGHRHYYMYC